MLASLNLKSVAVQPSCPNQCYERVLLGEAYLLPRNAFVEAENTSTSSITESVCACNLLFTARVFRTGNNREALARAMMATGAKESGTGVNVDAVDLGSIQSVLDQLDTRGIEHSSNVLGPMAEQLFRTVTANGTRYLDVATSMPDKSPLAALIEAVKPLGAVKTTGLDGMTKLPQMNRYWCKTLRHGTVSGLDDMPLRLPVERVFGEEIGYQPCPGNRVVLYLAIGPGNELLCGDDRPLVEASEPTQLMKARVIRGADADAGRRAASVIYDQKLTCAFVFAAVGTSKRAVAEQLATKCRAYTKCGDQVARRFVDLALVRLAVVPTRRDSFTRDGSTMLVHNYHLCPANEWYYLPFEYEAERPDDLRRDRAGENRLAITREEAGMAVEAARAYSVLPGPYNARTHRFSMEPHGSDDGAIDVPMRNAAAQPVGRDADTAPVSIDVRVTATAIPAPPRHHSPVRIPVMGGTGRTTSPVDIVEATLPGVSLDSLIPANASTNVRDVLLSCGGSSSALQRDERPAGGGKAVKKPVVERIKPLPVSKGGGRRATASKSAVNGTIAI